MQNNAPKNNHRFEQPEKITISQISNSQKITRAPLSKFFPVPPPGDNAISLILRRKLEGLLTMGGGGEGGVSP